MEEKFLLFVSVFFEQSAELENTMTAVERVVEYESVDPEDELEATGDRKPPPDWPQQGAIIFDKLSMRYFPDPASELVLKELDFDILPSEKVIASNILFSVLL